MRILTIPACLLIAACNVKYAAYDDGIAWKTTMVREEENPQTGMRRFPGPG